MTRAASRLKIPMPGLAPGLERSERIKFAACFAAGMRQIRRRVYKRPPCEIGSVAACGRWVWFWRGHTQAETNVNEEAHKPPFFAPGIGGMPKSPRNLSKHPNKENSGAEAVWRDTVPGFAFLFWSSSIRPAGRFRAQSLLLPRPIPCHSRNKNSPSLSDAKQSPEPENYKVTRYRIRRCLTLYNSWRIFC